MSNQASLSADEPTVLITGASRGLGLAFAEQYAGKRWNVIATCRTPEAATGLRDLAGRYPRLVVEKLDVTRDDDVAALAAKYAGRPIDVLLNNAGIYGTLAKQALGAMDFEEARRVLDAFFVVYNDMGFGLPESACAGAPRSDV